MKKGNDKKEYSSEELKRHVGAILEQVKYGFKAQNEYFMGVNQKLAKMQKTLDSHTEEIVQLLVDTTVLKSDMKEIKSELKNKADKSEVLKISGRAATLEIRT
jgi:hypothetical protein